MRSQGRQRNHSCTQDGDPRVGSTWTRSCDAEELVQPCRNLV